MILTGTGMFGSNHYPIWVAGGDGDNYTIAWSTNGTTWNPVINSVTLFYFHCDTFAYDGTKWLAGGNGISPSTTRMAISYDGKTWTSNTGANSIFSQSVRQIVYNGSMWVAIGTGVNTFAYSYDGITWAASTSGNALFTSPQGIAWNGSIWVAGGFSTNNRVGYSYDGINWTASTSGNALIPGTGFNPGSALNPVWNGTVWVLSGAGGGATNRIIYSYDGINWLPSANGNSIFSGATYLAANSSIIIGSGGYSTDGINWTASTGAGSLSSIFTAGFKTAAWDGFIWRAVGNGVSKGAYSTDGINWTSFTGLNSIFNNGAYGIASKPAPNLYPPIS